MQDELILRRMFLKNEMAMLMAYFMKETDKEEARKILVAMRDRAKKIEEINCELAGIELRKIIKGKGES